ncbi:MAG: carbohydrate ABC transporter permease [Anaerolineales bacterium]|nr:MAG: carbohydrate ABC transporter permease [Chloroflexota bacterium]MBE7434620.1 carbohydrate ABC transporter permease [Anaerolineales bacterium]GJQ37193.1 MAG: ABC transporter permease [Anaerolineaceae bacterium]
MPRYLTQFFIRFGLIAFTLLSLGPVVWSVVTSLLPLSALTSKPPDLNPLNITLENYSLVLDSSRGLFSGLINSFIIATFTAAVGLVIGSMAAYALARLNLPGSNKILMMILATQMFPGIVIAIPLFLVMSRTRLVDTHFGLIVVYLSFILPIVIWILKGFFESVPMELERAAAVDGANPIQTFRYIVLPISLPPLFATGVFAFIEAWNEFFFAIILTRINVKTASIAIAEFSGQYQTLYGQMLASAVLASIPVVALAIIFRHFILEGFVEGAIKA